MNVGEFVGILRFVEISLVPLRGNLVELINVGPVFSTLPIVVGFQLYAGLFREDLNRLAKLYLFDLREEIDRSPALVA